MLAKETIERVREFPDIVRVISTYVKLTKRGRNHIGLCPFHSERTPSFTVSAEKRIWHCFGCHESGDLIAFVQKIDQLSFVESVKVIAQAAHIEVIEEHQPSRMRPEDKERQLLLDMISESKQFFIDQLKQQSSALDYLVSRGLEQRTIDKWQLGYAPYQSDLSKMFQSVSRYHDVMDQSGVINQTDSGTMVCRFRDRVMFPIVDHNGRTLGFGGRKLDEQSKMAKYINSDENRLFSKRRLLFGLYRAKHAIKKVGHAILMEGFMDVITAHQFGFAQSIGCMGTSFTIEQAQLLSRYTDTVYLAMDDDYAGKESVKRAYDILKAQSYKVMVIRFESGDPADFLVAHGTDAFQQKIQSARSIVETLIQDIMDENVAISSEMIPNILIQLVPLLRQEKNPLILGRYVTMISHQFGIASELILSQVQQPLHHRFSSRRFQQVKDSNKYQRAEDLLLLALAINIEERHALCQDIALSKFVTPSGLALFDLISKSDVAGYALLETIEDGPLRTKLSELLINAPQDQMLSQDVLKKCVFVLSEYRARNRIAEIKDELRRSQDQPDDAKEESLMLELQDLKTTFQFNSN